MNKKKTIEFTDDQYKSLVKLIFYGDWVLTANKIRDEDADIGAEELREYIFSQKERFSLKSWFEELDYGEELKDGVIRLLLEKVFEYNEETFWFYLIKKLSERDAEIEHWENGEKRGDFDAISDLEIKYETKYEKAFENKSVDNLFLKE